MKIEELETALHEAKIAYNEVKEEYREVGRRLDAAARRVQTIEDSINQHYEGLYKRAVSYGGDNYIVYRVDTQDKTLTLVDFAGELIYNVPADEVKLLGVISE